MCAYAAEIVLPVKDSYVETNYCIWIVCGDRVASQGQLCWNKLLHLNRVRRSCCQSRTAMLKQTIAFESCAEIVLPVKDSYVETNYCIWIVCGDRIASQGQLCWNKLLHLNRVRRSYSQSRTAMLKQTIAFESCAETVLPVKDSYVETNYCIWIVCGDRIASQGQLCWNKLLHLNRVRRSCCQSRTAMLKQTIAFESCAEIVLPVKDSYVETNYCIWIVCRDRIASQGQLCWNKLLHLNRVRRSCCQSRTAMLKQTIAFESCAEIE